jgi:flagellar biosynthesis protein FliQ
MKNLIQKLAYTMLVLLSVFILGIFFPLLISVFVASTTKITFSECIEFVPFWVICFLGWFIAIFYVNEKITE